nr:ATP-dependent DNA helicase PIF1-like [Tanacetum cinerariifolium]
MAALYILDKLTEIADSSCLQDKMKVVFSQARSEDESFIGFMCDLCSGLMLSLTKNQRLIAELEALGQRADAFKPLEYTREMVARDSTTLGVLKQLLVGILVRMRLKVGYVADMEETKKIGADTYPNFIERHHDDKYLKEWAILTPKIDDIDAISAYMFNKLAGKSSTYNSANEICKASTETLDQQQLYLTEFLNTLNFPRNAASCVMPKKGTPNNASKKQNEEWVNVIVDGLDAEMTDGVALSTTGSVFMQGISHVDDVAEVMTVGSERVSSGLTDVVMALFVGENGDSSFPSFAVDEEATTNLLGFRFGFSLFLSQFSVRGGVVCRMTLVAPSLGQTDCKCVVVHQEDPKSCHPP